MSNVKKRKTSITLVTCFIDGSLKEEINKIINKEKKNRADELSKQFRSIFDQYRPTPLLSVSASSKLGDYYMDMIFSYLNKLMRSASQKEMHEYFLGSCIRAIYGEEGYKKNRGRVIDKYNLPTRQQQVLVC